MSRPTSLDKLDTLTPWQAMALGCATAASVVGGAGQLGVWYGCVAGLACLGAAIPLALRARWIIEARRAPFERLPATEFRPAMLPIEAGEFLMGSPDGVGHSDEHPQQRVALNAFYVGETVVTQAQWTALGFENRSDFRDSPTNPVENVSWFDAIRFCNALSKREGLAPAYRLSGPEDEPTVTRIEGASGYRLPTEAEWEYAARAGTTTRWSFGDDEARLVEHACYGENAGGKTHPVARKKPNPWGLYDVHGNVWEWCEDGTSAKDEVRPYAAEAVMDPRLAPSGPRRMVRGGSWRSGADWTRSAVRHGRSPTFPDKNRGFRLVRPPPSSALDHWP